jgi:hypothetical protein
MSYTIYYDKLFIRTSDNKYVPIILQGDNNVWELNNKRRSRDWEFRKKKTENGQIIDLWSKEDVLAELADAEKSAKATREYSNQNGYSKGPYDPRDFGDLIGLAIGGGRCSKTTFDKYKSFWMSGMKNSITFDQLKEYGGLSMQSYWYHNDELEKLSLEPLKRMQINTEEEFLEAIKIAEKYDQMCSITLSYMDERKVKRLREKFFPKNKREKQLINVEKYFALEVFQKGTDYYVGNFLRASKSGFKHSYMQDGGKRYLTEKEVDAAAAKQTARFTQYDFRKKEMNVKTSVYA